MVLLSEQIGHDFQTFQVLLRRVRAIATQAHPDGRALQGSFLEAQQWFQQRLIRLETTALDPAIAPLVQTAQTEINKLLRLLGTDVMFLQTARQPLTQQQRQKQLCDRLDQLLGYCAAVLGEDDPHEA